MFDTYNILIVYEISLNVYLQMSLFLLKYGKQYISTFDNIKPSNLYEMYVTIYYSIITKFIYPMTLLQLDRKLKGLRNLVIYFVIFDLLSSSLIFIKHRCISHVQKSIHLQIAQNELFFFKCTIIFIIGWEGRGIYEDKCIFASPGLFQV